MRQTALLIAGLTMALAGPAQALEPPTATGPCLDNEAWMAFDQLVLLGPCDASGAEIFRLICGEGEGRWTLQLADGVPGLRAGEPGTLRFETDVGSGEVIGEGIANPSGGAPRFEAALAPENPLIPALRDGSYITYFTDRGPESLPLIGAHIALASAERTCLKGTV